MKRTAGTNASIVVRDRKKPTMPKPKLANRQARSYQGERRAIQGQLGALERHSGPILGQNPRGRRRRLASLR
jgi:hypothetical protein